MSLGLRPLLLTLQSVCFTGTTTSAAAVAAAAAASRPSHHPESDPTSSTTTTEEKAIMTNTRMSVLLQLGIQPYTRKAQQTQTRREVEKAYQHKAFEALLLHGDATDMSSRP